jgi:hypothetical protein
LGCQVWQLVRPTGTLAQRVAEPKDVESSPCLWSFLNMGFRKKKITCIQYVDPSVALQVLAYLRRKYFKRLPALIKVSLPKLFMSLMRDFLSFSRGIFCL